MTIMLLPSPKAYEAKAPSMAGAMVDLGICKGGHGPLNLLLFFYIFIILNTFF